jgi:ribosomal-protein-alanine N-acetyltransferase
MKMVKIRYMKRSEVDDISSFRRTHLGEYIEDKFKNYIKKNPGSVFIANPDTHEKEILGYAFAYLWRVNTGIIHHILCVKDSKDAVEGELLSHLEKRFLERKLDRVYAWAREDQENLIKNLYSLNYNLDCEMLVFENYASNPLPRVPKVDEDVEIEDFTEDHLEDVITIETKCFKPSWHQNKEDFLKYAKRKNSWFSVAKDIDSVVAYLQITACGKLGYIGRVAVIPGYQRKGLGTMLMNEAMKWFGANSATKIKLRTPQTDIPAQNLYKKFGFSEIGREYEFVKQF